jgi:hypothetical protein
MSPRQHLQQFINTHQFSNVNINPKPEPTNQTHMFNKKQPIQLPIQATISLTQPPAPQPLLPARSAADDQQYKSQIKQLEDKLMKSELQLHEALRRTELAEEKVKHKEQEIQ